MADYQKSPGFRNGLNPDMIGARIKGKKMVFIQPTNKSE